MSIPRRYRLPAPGYRYILPAWVFLFTRYRDQILDTIEANLIAFLREGNDKGSFRQIDVQGCPGSGAGPGEFNAVFALGAIGKVPAEGIGAVAQADQGPAGACTTGRSSI